MVIALAQVNCRIGDFEFNTGKIIQAINRAKQQGARLVIFPELAVCGYPPLDLLNFSDFISRSQQTIDSISHHTEGIAVIIGAPAFNMAPKGKQLFNSAFLIDNGKLIGQVNKTLLPTYDVFDESRYFEPGKSNLCFQIEDQKIALTICEDLWNEQDDPLYLYSPMEELIKFKPSVIINIAASPFDYNQAEKREAVLKRNALKYGLPLIYVNHCGGQTEMQFDGGSLIMNAGGEVAAQAPFFQEDLLISELPVKSKAVLMSMSTIEKIYHALIMGIRDYFEKCSFSKATLGLSGGLDSAVVLVLAVEALGKENVIPVMMPSPFSTAHSITDSVQLTENLGVESKQISISEIYDAVNRSLQTEFADRPFDITEENIQSRIRGILLMALSNKFGFIVLNTSNKSELATGYGTLYGDMCGGLSVIGDVFKTDVYQLAAFINRKNEVIPGSIISKQPSAELRPDQKDTDSLPPYPILDSILKLYIETNASADEIAAAGFDKQLVVNILNMVIRSEFKRFQAPPVLRVSPKAFGPGRRIPLTGKYRP